MSFRQSVPSLVRSSLSPSSVCPFLRLSALFHFALFLCRESNMFKKIPENTRHPSYSRLLTFSSLYSFYLPSHFLSVFFRFCVECWGNESCLSDFVVTVVFDSPCEFGAHDFERLWKRKKEAHMGQEQFMVSTALPLWRNRRSRGTEGI